jgi:hypothetical protein
MPCISHSSLDVGLDVWLGCGFGCVADKFRCKSLLCIWSCTRTNWTVSTMLHFSTERVLWGGGKGCAVASLLCWPVAGAGEMPPDISGKHVFHADFGKVATTFGPLPTKMLAMSPSGCILAVGMVGVLRLHHHHHFKASWPISGLCLKT